MRITNIDHIKRYDSITIWSESCFYARMGMYSIIYLEIIDLSYIYFTEYFSPKLNSRSRELWREIGTTNP